MYKLYKQTVGNSLAIAIEGESNEEVTQRYYSFYNHEATNAEFHWIGEKFGYFYTNETKLRAALVNVCLFKILNDNPYKYKKKRHGAILEAKQEAEKIFNSIEDQEFRDSRSIALEIYTTGLPNEDLVDYLSSSR